MANTDLHGLALSTGSQDTARAFNHAVLGSLSYRADAPQRPQRHASRRTWQRWRSG
jgi:hypothetical protein